MRTTTFVRVVSLSLAMAAAGGAGVAIAADNDGLTLPAGFTATVVQEGSAPAVTW